MGTKGAKPSVCGFGLVKLSIWEISVIISPAKGISFSCHVHFAPNAEGSVHIPNSDQNPGRKITSGNSRTALRLASNHIRSLEK